MGKSEADHDRRRLGNVEASESEMSQTVICWETTRYINTSDLLACWKLLRKHTSLPYEA